MSGEPDDGNEIVVVEVDEEGGSGRAEALAKLVGRKLCSAPRAPKDLDVYSVSRR